MWTMRDQKIEQILPLYLSGETLVAYRQPSKGQIKRTLLTVWRQIELKSLNGTLFSHVWRRGRLALDPLQK